MISKWYGPAWLLAILVLITFQAFAQEPVSTEASLLSLVMAGALGLLTHMITELISFRTAHPSEINSYFTGNWPQLALAVIGVVSLIFVPELIGAKGALTPLSVYLAGIAGGALSNAGDRSWGEVSKE